MKFQHADCLTRSEFVIDTQERHNVLSSDCFRPHVGEIKRHDVGSMISMMTGKALDFRFGTYRSWHTLYWSKYRGV